MAKTPSNMIPLGTKAPDFNLLNTCNREMVALKDVKSDTATVIMFICNHCPYVIHILKKLVEVAQSYQEKGVSFVAISSNDASHYPDDSPENMSKMADKNGFTFPYLYDVTQVVAKAYQAACTPDFFVFDKDLKCVYRGRFDEATPGNGKDVTGKDLTNALDNMLAGKKVSDEQVASVGCNIKWK